MILTGVEVRLEFAFGGLNNPDVRRVRSGGDTGDLVLPVSFWGELNVDGSVDDDDDGGCGGSGGIFIVYIFIRFESVTNSN